jgi:hypothetical protein
VDLREDRERLERILLGQEALVNEVRTWLEEEDTADAVVEAAIRSSGDDRMNALHGLSPARIFGRRAIRDLCVRYRLRFLPSALYKGEIPRQAIAAVRALESGTGQVLRGYHILAPARRFRLCDADADPLLFVRIGADRYYLIHRWGSDLSPLARAGALAGPCSVSSRGHRAHRGPGPRGGDTDRMDHPRPDGRVVGSPSVSVRFLVDRGGHGVHRAGMVRVLRPVQRRGMEQSHVQLRP